MEIEKLKNNNKELRELAKVLKEHDVFRILEESGKWVSKKEDS
jgi:hypothetical protein